MKTILAWADRLAPALAMLALGGMLVHSAMRIVYWSYDESVYFDQACRFLRGETPYRDFSAPQPPGILLLGAASQALGFGLTGVRVAVMLSALGSLVLTGWLARRVAMQSELPQPMLVAGLAVVFQAFTVEFVLTALEAATFAPAAFLTLLASLPLFTSRRRRYLISGLLLGVATLVRMQAASLVPMMAVIILAMNPRREAIRGILSFGLGFAFLMLSTHGLLYLTWTGYWEGTVRFHAIRPRVDLATRWKLFAAFGSQWQVMGGLAASLVFAFQSRPMMRAIGCAALVAILATTFGGNSFFRPYFVLGLPFLAVAGSLLVVELQQRLRCTCGFIFAATVLIVLNSVPILNGLRQADEAADRKGRFLDAIRTSPAQLWISTDGTLPTLAGKAAFADYHSSDPVALDLVSKAKFQEWFLSGMAQADAVAVTDLLSMLVTPDTAQRILDSGKPLVYESRSARERLEHAAGQSRSKVPSEQRD